MLMNKLLNRASLDYGRKFSVSGLKFFTLISPLFSMFVTLRKNFIFLSFFSFAYLSKSSSEYFLLNFLFLMNDVLTVNSIYSCCIEVMRLASSNLAILPTLKTEK